MAGRRREGGGSRAGIWEGRRRGGGALACLRQQLPLDDAHGEEAQEHLRGRRRRAASAGGGGAGHALGRARREQTTKKGAGHRVEYWRDEPARPTPLVRWPRGEWPRRGERASATSAGQASERGHGRRAPGWAWAACPSVAPQVSRSRCRHCRRCRRSRTCAPSRPRARTPSRDPTAPYHPLEPQPCSEHSVASEAVDDSHAWLASSEAALSCRATPIWRRRP